MEKNNSKQIKSVYWLISREEYEFICKLCIFGKSARFPCLSAHPIEVGNFVCYFLAKEVISMKNCKTLIAKIAKAAAEKALKADANQTTCVLFYQPKVPAGLSQFKKTRV